MRLEPLRPGAQLMRRLRLPTKLGVLATVLVVPLVIISVLLTQRINDAIAFTRAEIDGAVIVERANALILEVQQHRGQTNAWLAGDARARDALAITREKLRAAQSAVQAALASRPDFALRDDWALLARSIAALEGTERTEASAAFALHSQTVHALNQFVYTAAERSNLLFDPEPASYFLMDLAVTRIPRWIELISQAQGLANGLPAQEQSRRQTLNQIQSQLAGARALSDDMAYLQGFTRKYGPQGFLGDEAISAARQFLAQADLGRPGRDGVETTVDLSTAGLVIESVVNYRDGVQRHLSALLEKRVLDDERQRQITIASASLGIALVLYLMLSFYASFVSDFGHAVKVMRETTSGNLRARIEIRGSDELAEMAALLQRMGASLSQMVAAVRSNSALVAFSGMNLASGNRDLAGRTEQQATSLQQTAASVQLLSSTVQQNAQAAGQSDEQAARVRDLAESGARAMQAAVEAVEDIQKRAQQMNEIIGVIDGLAFQTNILALNAAVEAARAGEQGRGFAVVASEVRTLAQRSASSATQIRQLIEASGQQVTASATQIRSAGDTMQQIVDGVRGVAGKMSLISAASADQSDGLTEISSAVGQLDQITQRNAQMVERALNQATLLEHRAGNLSKAVSAFQLLQGTAEEAMALVARAQAHRTRVEQGAFVRELTEKANRFFDRDMYVFALDRAGVYRAFGGNPDKVGSRVQDIPGVDGEALLQAIIQQADDEPGWVEYDITNPTSGLIQTKMSYVVRIDDLYVGCGVYKSAATA